jgi:ABC-type transport system involved in cytochrome bd biosynthesis fused ATPase/permease subunit
MEQTNFYLETDLGHYVGLTKMGSQAYKGKIIVNDVRHDFMYNSMEKQIYLMPQQPKLDEESLKALDNLLY